MEKDAAYQYLEQLVGQNGIGAREAGTIEEKQTATFIVNAFKALGYQPKTQAFNFGVLQDSANIIVDSNPNAALTVILGAHYDSTAANKGSLGAIDNGAGVAAMLAIAKNIAQRQKPSKINIRFIAFGAEENGLKGSKYYVSQLVNQPKALKNIIAMINFDTIAGGDITYVHSAHTTPYKCADNDLPFNSDTLARDALLSASQATLSKEHHYTIHPAYPGYPEGVTGAWSDHAPFACAGIPIAYVESTNFTINGEDGFDGYSQTTHEETWDCFDKTNKTACQRDEEKQWGKMWHTKFDQLDKINTLFPGRLARQLTQNVTVLTELLNKPELYLFK
ncbi:M28 family metallopeptidase [Thalassotalea sediminis]|uniref:M28 family metallopeptidase n=1 Tax=Thalassotalea sediminis TaxID=1759089 RepID=UPI002573C8A0|nr:M28 family metallopeptidase [Thalassotalea sediminis]